jgi:hypothetical protein
LFYDCAFLLLQLFKASDNSNVATLTHGSRINRACFTTVHAAAEQQGEDKESGRGAQGWRLVSVCDNKTVNFFDFDGKQVCTSLHPVERGQSAAG